MRCVVHRGGANEELSFLAKAPPLFVRQERVYTFHSLDKSMTVFSQQLVTLSSLSCFTLYGKPYKSLC